MSSRLSHRFAVSALLLAVLLLLAAPPAQAGSRSSLLDNLGAKVQSWLAAWLPGAGIQGEGATARVGQSQGAHIPGSLTTPGVGRHGDDAGRSVHHSRIRVECAGQSDPNGCP
jgi:hypothetical protein